ncbi:MAG: ribosomal protein S18 acetylase RimI-like enzyme [Cellvibrionaceae bacterium]|jgi:ribosomal protein S18 acetylase RimI-like enzyme
MIAFRLITAQEFPNYRAYFIPDYAAEIESNYGYSAEESLAQATKSVADEFPNGVSTTKNLLHCITKEGNGTIGYLWYTLNNEDKSAFILDFVILENFRGSGLGKASLNAFEAELTTAGIKQIKLRVAGDNQRAFKLYERMGFNVTGINMIKHLGKND